MSAVLKRTFFRKAVILSIAGFAFMSNGFSAQEEYRGALAQGMEYMKQRLYDDAIAAFTIGIEDSSQDADAYVYRGYAYAQRGDLERALADYNKALLLNSDYAEAYALRAGIYLFEKDYDNAWYDIHKAESLGYEVPSAFLEELKSMSGREE